MLSREELITCLNDDIDAKQKALSEQSNYAKELDVTCSDASVDESADVIRKSGF